MRERRSNDTPPTASIARKWVIMGLILVAFIVFAIISAQGPKLNTKEAHVRPNVVNINRASLAELDSLPHISETVAQAIIDGRPYTSTDDLIRVYGIGPKTLEGIRPFVKINDKTPNP